VLEYCGFHLEMARRGQTAPSALATYAATMEVLRGALGSAGGDGGSAAAAAAVGPGSSGAALEPAAATGAMEPK
jgi:hypothetical protein